MSSKLTKKQAKELELLVQGLQEKSENIQNLIGTFHEERATLFEAVQAAEDVLVAAIEKFNEECETMFTDVEGAVEEYNEAVLETREWIEERASDFESYREGRSEKWQESEKGEAFETFIQSWQDIDLDEIEIERPEELSYVSDLDPELDELEYEEPDFEAIVELPVCPEE